MAEEDPMFVIKNLDTGLEMRIDDFDRLANIATNEVQDNEPVQKKGGLTKGTKALKHWTAATAKKATATAKKAVSGIKDVAQELNVPSVLSKHRAGAGQLPEASPSKAGPGQLLVAPLADLLVRRSTTAESDSAAGTEVGQSGSSAAPLTASEPSTISTSHSLRQQSANSSNDSAAATEADLGGPSLIAPSLSAPLAAGVSAVPGSSAATATAALQAGAASPAPAVPAAVRLVSQKRAAHLVQDVVLAQVLEASCGVVWAVAFSRDGSLLATAGQDGILRVWQLTASRDKDVRSNWVYAPVAAAASKGSIDDSSIQADDELEGSHDQQQLQQNGENSNETAAEQQQQQRNDSLEQQGPELVVPAQPEQQQQQQQHIEPPIVEFGPYFSQQPVRQYVGHTEDILDVSWSAGGFLLTASLDKSVRLWHVSQPDCLRQFWHTDFVTGVQFHPLDAQRFVSGSIDGKIRVWSITDNAVLATAQLHQDMVTAAGFSLDGSRVLAGTMRGRVRFYELADKKLEYVTQVDARNQRGQHASGKKVTGICTVPGQPQKFLITTNDSRLRLLEGYGQVMKFKGHKNTTTQIRAALSFDGSKVVCGSDDGWVYVWQLAQACGTAAGAASGSGQAGRSVAATAGDEIFAGKNAAYQAFHAHEAGVPVTAVAFAPSGVCDGKPSVLLSHGGGVGAAGSGAAGPEGEGIAVRPGFAARTVQNILVSGGFSGTIRVHELL